AECLDPLSFRRLATAGDVKEIAIEIARDPAGQLLAVELQRACKTRNLIRRQRELFGVDPYGIDGRAHRERLAVSICDRAAMRSDYRGARESRVSFLRQEGVIDKLQIDRAP